MYLRALKYLPAMAILHGTIAGLVYGQAAGPAATGGADLTNALNLNSFETATLEVYLKGADGKPVQVAAVVTLLKLSSEGYRQETAKAGHARFSGIVATEYSVQVSAPGYRTAVKQVEAKKDQARVVTFELERLSVEDAAENTAYRALAPKAQKEIGKALELLRAQKVADARSHLDAANRAAPGQAEVQYLYGVYAKQVGNAEQAKSYWTKALEFSPTHLPALLALADVLLQENRGAEALPYATRAVEVEPSSWRAHAILSNVYLRHGSADAAAKEAERALELGHEQAAMVEPVLAGALASKGEKERALTVLHGYLKEHPSDQEAKSLVGALERISAAEGPSAASPLRAEELSLSTSGAAALPLPSSWLPPDVDEKMPPVEAGASCALDEVLEKAGKRAQAFIKNVERFTASEFMKHETIDKWGVAAIAETRKFDYVAAIEEPKPGVLIVEEYRDGRGAPADFPGGVVTNGLPGLALVFHPDNVVNFAMTCEGLSRWDGQPAWQVHFRQRRDRPNTVRSYRLGLDGPSYTVALKGRAWILADSFEIARLETDLIAPVPQIQLVADHTDIEYGPVQFRRGEVQMWLPQSAEVYFDWKGRRVHRRHTFSNYMLFAVDEKQQIAEPKAQN